MINPFNPWILLGLLVALLAAFGSGFKVSKHYAEAECTSGQVQAERTAISQAATETTRREAIGVARETSRENIHIVYRTIRDQANAVRVVTGGSDIAGCGLNADGLLLWNAANSGVPATLPGESDGGLPSTAASAVGGTEGFVGQPHRGDGAVRPMPGQADEVGGVRK